MSIVTAASAEFAIVSRVCAPVELSRGERDEAFALLALHFDGVAREQFEADLAEKNVVLTLRDAASGALTGFSTMLVYETTVAGSLVSVVCSGDTITDPTAWSSPALPREWIAAVNRLRGDYPRGRYYWLLITSGFRTYRLLSTFWERFHPRHDEQTSPDRNRMLDALAAERFGDRYDARDGIVRFARPQVLRPHLAGIQPQRMNDPHVAFFARRNPGHVRGDELACLCELSEDNLSRAGRRMVFRAATAAATASRKE
jgi:hypothetical protein